MLEFNILFIFQVTDKRNVVRGRGFVHQEEAGEDDRGGRGSEPGTGPPQEPGQHEDQPLYSNIDQVMLTRRSISGSDGMTKSDSSLAL